MKRFIALLAAIGALTASASLQAQVIAAHVEVETNLPPWPPMPWPSTPAGATGLPPSPP